MTQKTKEELSYMWVLETKEYWLEVFSDPPGVLCWMERDKAEEWVRTNRLTCTIKQLSFAAIRTYLQRRGLEYLYAHVHPGSNGELCGYQIRLGHRKLKIGHHRC